VGDGEHCAERLRGVVDRGITSFFLRDFASYTLPHDLVETFGSEVIPRLGELNIRVDT
jgi:hypothetical protein